VIFISDPFRRIFDRIGFVPEMIFASLAIVPWRKLPDRENCTWDFSTDTGAIRLHVKRFPPMRSSPAKLEADGYRLLEENGIPTANVAAWGILDDGRSFIATEDLAGFTPADKLIEFETPFDRLLIPTADLAARLHNAGLHHRDLYLCHFLARLDENKPIELRLIDAARVRRLPGPLTRRRWIVKDLAQFWYSTLGLNVSDTQRDAWLRRYCGQTKIPQIEALKKSIIRKSDMIAAHDRKLRARQPRRNISIPQ
jgi:hypothetical protein